MLRFGLGDKVQARALLATSGEEDAQILLGLLQ
ncbi:DUF1039 domain-containing protein, partial [Yersinia pestis]